MGRGGTSWCCCSTTSPTSGTGGGTRWASLSSTLAQLKGLAGANWVVALDLKGFGDSDKPFLTRQYREEVLVEELRQFVDVLQVRMVERTNPGVQESERKIILIGHGLGGHLAW